MSVVNVALQGKHRWLNQQTVSQWLQVQLPDSGVCDASVQEREAVLSRVGGAQG